MSRFVTGEGFDHLAGCAGLKGIQQWGDRLFVLGRKDEVVTFVEKGDEVEIVLMSSGPEADGDIRFALPDGPCSLAMGADRPLIAADFSGWDILRMELHVKPQACSRAGIAVDEENVGPDEIHQGADALWVS
jgi:hypothetical protein